MYTDMYIYIDTCVSVSPQGRALCADPVEAVCEKDNTTTLGNSLIGPTPAIP